MKEQIDIVQFYTHQTPFFVQKKFVFIHKKIVSFCVSAGTFWAEHVILNNTRRLLTELQSEENSLLLVVEAKWVILNTKGGSVVAPRYKCGRL